MRSRRWLLFLCGNGSDLEKLLPAKTVSLQYLFRPVATQHEWFFLPTVTESSFSWLRHVMATIKIAPFTPFLGSSTPMERKKFF